MKYLVLAMLMMPHNYTPKPDPNLQRVCMPSNGQPCCSTTCTRTSDGGQNCQTQCY